MSENKRRKSTGQITLSDVAKLAGVGTMTVSRALRTPDQVSDKLREKIEFAVQSLGYRPNLAASALASASSNNLIAIITSKIYDTDNHILFDSLQTTLVAHNYTTIIVEAYRYKNKPDLLTAISSYNLAAIVLFNMDKNSHLQADIIGKNIPIVAIGAHPKSDFDINIGIDNMQAMYALTQKVIQKGYRYIGLLCANHEHSLFQQRLHGWHKAMLDNHLPTHRVINAALPANFSTGSQLLPDFILNWPEIDALICTTDELAGGVLYECQRRHIRVPYQLAVTGFGDNEFSQVCNPPLTTISIPSQQIGKYAALSLLQQLDTQHKLVVPELPSIESLLKMRGST